MMIDDWRLAQSLTVREEKLLLAASPIPLPTDSTCTVCNGHSLNAVGKACRWM